ncbi:MAG: TetR/AcrR family transcriptional regulator [Elusimicrobiales bacterium]|jgi:AcrR family transcriptional regulator|nr:TetR/AcrR family transcriptional regulator [Elusimicrobiales bacterium]
MARPASGTDIKLKAAGKELLREKGVTGFGVREACRRAGVNTGMFHYHFGSREEFLRAVMKEMYADFMVDFRAGVSAGGSPRDKLKNALVQVGRFARSMRRAAPMVLADLAHGNKEAFSFMKSNFTEHIGEIAALAAEARPRSALKAHSVPYMVGAMVPVMIFPVIIGGIMERNGVKELRGEKLSGLMEEFISDSGIEERAEIALRGIGL